MTKGSALFILVLTVSFSACTLLPNSQPSPTPQPSIVIFPIPSLRPLDTKNWKNYTNSALKYKFKYPPTWKVFASNNDKTRVNITDSTGKYKVDVYQQVIKDYVLPNKMTLSSGLTVDFDNNPENTEKTFLYDIKLAPNTYISVYIPNDNSENQNSALQILHTFDLAK